MPYGMGPMDPDMTEMPPGMGRGGRPSRRGHGARGGGMRSSRGGGGNSFYDAAPFVVDGDNVHEDIIDDMMDGVGDPSQ